MNNWDNGMDVEPVLRLAQELVALLAPKTATRKTDARESEQRLHRNSARAASTMHSHQPRQTPSVKRQVQDKPADKPENREATEVSDAVSSSRRSRHVLDDGDVERCFKDIWFAAGPGPSEVELRNEIIIQQYFYRRDRTALNVFRSLLSTEQFSRSENPLWNSSGDDDSANPAEEVSPDFTPLGKTDFPLSPSPSPADTTCSTPERASLEEVNLTSAPATTPEADKPKRWRPMQWLTREKEKMKQTPTTSTTDETTEPKFSRNDKAGQDNGAKEQTTSDEKEAAEDKNPGDNQKKKSKLHLEEREAKKACEELREELARVFSQPNLIQWKIFAEAMWRLRIRSFAHFMTITCHEKPNAVLRVGPNEPEKLEYMSEVAENEKAAAAKFIVMATKLADFILSMHSLVPKICNVPVLPSPFISVRELCATPAVVTSPDDWNTSFIFCRGRTLPIFTKLAADEIATPLELTDTVKRDLLSFGIWDTDVHRRGAPGSLGPPPSIIRELLILARLPSTWNLAGSILQSAGQVTAQSSGSTRNNFGPKYSKLMLDLASENFNIAHGLKALCKCDTPTSDSKPCSQCAQCLVSRVIVAIITPWPSPIPVSRLRVTMPTSLALPKVPRRALDSSEFKPISVTIADAPIPLASGLEFVDPLNLVFGTVCKRSMTSFFNNVISFRKMPIFGMTLDPVSESKSSSSNSAKNSAANASFASEVNKRLDVCINCTAARLDAQADDLSTYCLTDPKASPDGYDAFQGFGLPHSELITKRYAYKFASRLGVCIPLTLTFITALTPPLQADRGEKPNPLLLQWRLWVRSELLKEAARRRFLLRIRAVETKHLEQTVLEFPIGFNCAPSSRCLMSFQPDRRYVAMINRSKRYFNDCVIRRLPKELRSAALNPSFVFHANTKLTDRICVSPVVNLHTLCLAATQALFLDELRVDETLAQQQQQHNCRIEQRVEAINANEIPPQYSPATGTIGRGASTRRCPNDSDRNGNVLRVTGLSKKLRISRVSKLIGKVLALDPLLVQHDPESEHINITGPALQVFVLPNIDHQRRAPFAVYKSADRDEWFSELARNGLSSDPDRGGVEPPPGVDRNREIPSPTLRVPTFSSANDVCPTTPYSRPYALRHSLSWFPVRSCSHMPSLQAGCETFTVCEKLPVAFRTELRNIVGAIGNLEVAKKFLNRCEDDIRSQLEHNISLARSMSSKNSGSKIDCKTGIENVLSHSGDCKCSPFDLPVSSCSWGFDFRIDGSSTFENLIQTYAVFREGDPVGSRVFPLPHSTDDRRALSHANACQAHWVDGTTKSGNKMWVDGEAEYKTYVPIVAEQVDLFVVVSNAKLALSLGVVFKVAKSRLDQGMMMLALFALNVFRSKFDNNNSDKESRANRIYMPTQSDVESILRNFGPFILVKEWSAQHIHKALLENPGVNLKIPPRRNESRPDGLPEFVDVPVAEPTGNQWNDSVRNLMVEVLEPHWIDVLCLDGQHSANNEDGIPLDERLDSLGFRTSSQPTGLPSGVLTTEDRFTRITSTVWCFVQLILGTGDWTKSRDWVQLAPEFYKNIHQLMFKMEIGHLDEVEYLAQFCESWDRHICYMSEQGIPS